MGVQVLLGILQQRIELDKECMFQFTQLRKEVGIVCMLKMIFSPVFPFIVI